MSEKIIRQADREIYNDTVTYTNTVSHLSELYLNAIAKGLLLLLREKQSETE